MKWSLPSKHKQEVTNTAVSPPHISGLKRVEMRRLGDARHLSSAGTKPPNCFSKLFTADGGFLSEPFTPKLYLDRFKAQIKADLLVPVAPVWSERLVYGCSYKTKTPRVTDTRLSAKLVFTRTSFQIGLFSLLMNGLIVLSLKDETTVRNAL